MADIEQAVYSRLTSVTAVSTMVSGRVYPTLIADSSTITPYIVYTRTSGEHVKSTAGMTGLAEANFDILCVTSGSSAYKDAKTLRDRVRVALDGYRGTTGGVAVRGVFIDDDLDEPNFAVGVDQQRRQAVGLQTKWFFVEGTT